MSNKIPTVQECDATKVQSGNKSWLHNHSTYFFKELTNKKNYQPKFPLRRI